MVRSLSFALCALLFALCASARAELTINYGFTTNASIPDGNGQYTTTHTLGGLSSFSNVTVDLNLTSPDVNNPMWLGDMYSTLTYGTASEAERVAVLLNRPGRDNTNEFGSSLSSLNVTLDDSASHTNIWATTSSTGIYNSDGRLGVNPYGAAVAFSNGDRNATLAALNGSSLTSNKFTLLMADTSAGGQAQLTSWGMAVTGTAAGSGTMSGDGGTFSITDDGGTNNLGAAVVTTQAGGGALNVTATGNLTFSGGVSGSGALNKLGSGTLTLSAAGTYAGGTTVNAGTLLATNSSGSSATGTGAVTVNNGGTLGGTGFINAGSNNVTINAGGTITGATNGTIGALTLTAANVTFGGVSGNLSTYLVDLSSSTSDKLAIMGNLNLSSLFDQISFQGTTGASSYQLITYTGTLSGTFDTETNLPSGYMLDYSIAGEIDLVTVVPEPGTWAAAALVLVTILWSRRTRSKRLFSTG